MTGNGGQPLRETRCPVCATPVLWTALADYRPFCSRRCQETDFLKWARSEYSLPAADDSQPWEDGAEG